jgi:hypothetical protein
MVTKTGSPSRGKRGRRHMHEKGGGSRNRARIVAFKARTQTDSHNSICLAGSGRCRRRIAGRSNALVSHTGATAL